MSTHIMQILRQHPPPPQRHSERRWTDYLVREAVRLRETNASDAEIEQAILDYDERHTGGSVSTHANRKRDARKVFRRSIAPFIEQLYDASFRVKVVKTRPHDNFVAVCKRAFDHPQGAAGWLAEHR